MNIIILELTENNFQIRINNIGFKELLYQTIAPYRTYCKHDIIIINKLLSMLNYLLEQDAFEDNYYKVIQDEKVSILNDAKDSISNKQDIEALNISYRKNK